MIKHAVATALALVAAVAPVAAGHPVEGPTLYRVRPGSLVLACGGFAGGCELRQLRGTIEISPGYNGHFTGDGFPPRIVASELELVTSAGHATPFPSAGDLPLTALDGYEDGSRLVFVDPPGSDGLQEAELTFTPFRDGIGSSGGFILDGFYDEGCCDRFRYQLGGVVLRPDGGSDALALQDGRFRVHVTWRTARGDEGAGKPSALDDESGYFWFFEPDNPEVFVKILDACALNGRFWVFAGGLTNLGVEITVVDGASDVGLPIVNPVGQKFATFADTQSLACSLP